jgi:hypothetical protein
MDLKFNETMAGTFSERAGKPSSGKFSFTIDVFCPNVKDPRVVVGDISGIVTMEGVVERAPLQGTIEISPMWNRTIKYAFTFTGPTGKPYTFAGHKSISMLRLLKTMTFLPGEVRDENGKLVAKVETTFDTLGDMVPFLMSFRMAPAGKGKAALSRT